MSLIISFICLVTALNQVAAPSGNFGSDGITVTAKVPNVTLKNPNFEQGWRGGKPPAWTVNWPGDASRAYRGTIDPDRPHQGNFSARLEFAGEKMVPGHYGTLAQGFSAVPYRGKTVQLIASARVGDDSREHVGLFVLTTNSTDRTLSVQNMTGHSISSSEWADYRVEIFVEPGAREIAFGLVLNGTGPAWIDDVRIRVVPNAPVE